MIPREWLEVAAERICSHIRRTDLTYIPDTDLYIKWENHQVTGSFKIRGALNRVLSLEPWERERGLVAASAGNHGQGVAFAGKLVDAAVIIFASENASPMKIAAMRDLGAEVRLVPGMYGDAEQAGLAYAKETGAAWISPYNDPQVIAGAGTIGLELCRELPGLDNAAWIVPVGGGGLISGIGAAIDDYHPRPRLIGAQSQASPFMHDLYKTGSQDNTVELDSLADGLAGSVEPGSVTIAMVQKMVDEFILVTEEEIAQAITFSWHNYGERIEGASAAALAAVLSGKVDQRPAVVLISGGNIQEETLQNILARTASIDGLHD